MKDSEIELALLKPLIYFDIFSYPLCQEEILEYCEIPALSNEKGHEVLESMTNKGIVGYSDGFYYLGKNSSKIKQRLEGNYLASKRIVTARKYAALIANFPFVRGVFISGSLSKNYMTPKSDIDFFIITEPGRLWLCRAFLTLFKKIFLLNSYRNFCINYFVDTNSLALPDNNIFTANEIASLLPMYNYNMYLNFMQLNNWYKNYYPNILLRAEQFVIKPFLVKKLAEAIFNNNFGNTLDDICFSITTKFWRRKFQNFDDETYNLSMRSWKNVSKHHPNDFQRKVLKILSEKLNQFQNIA